MLGNLENFNGVPEEFKPFLFPALFLDNFDRYFLMALFVKPFANDGA